MTDKHDWWSRFRLGDAMPADSQLAQWITTVGLIYNDMAVTSDRLAQLMDTRREDAYERLYLSRLQLAHFREAVRFLHESHGKCPEVAAFVSLDYHANDNVNESGLCSVPALFGAFCCVPDSLLIRTASSACGSFGLGCIVRE